MTSLKLSQQMSSKLRSPFVQYLIGVLINISYLAILITNQTSYQNLQVPENTYSENLWKGSDVLTYVHPARNFVNYRVFGFKTFPDVHRTIGYPLFLSMMMMVFGDHWLIPTLFAQAMLFALMYPLLSKILEVVLGHNTSLVILVFFFLVFSGTYTVRVPVIMTDTFFTVFLTLGLWLGLESITRGSYLYLLLHVIFIGYAAQIRPVLSFFPLIDCFILAAVALRFDLARRTRTYRIVIASFILLLVICNLPSIRNYRNYHFPRPTDLLAENIVGDLGKNVLVAVGREDEYEEMQKLGQDITDLNARANHAEKLAMRIYAEHPVATLKRMMHNAVGILGRAHWPLVANFWGYSFQDNFSPPLRKSTPVYVIESFFNLVYLCVFLLFLASLLRISGQNIVFSLTIVLFFAYFLVPTFIIGGQGSRFRLTVEGLMVIMALHEFAYHFRKLNFGLHSLNSRQPNGLL